MSTLLRPGRQSLRSLHRVLAVAGLVALIATGSCGSGNGPAGGGGGHFDKFDGTWDLTFLSTLSGEGPAGSGTLTTSGTSITLKFTPTDTFSQPGQVTAQLSANGGMITLTLDAGAQSFFTTSQPTVQLIRSGEKTSSFGDLGGEWTAVDNSSCKVVFSQATITVPGNCTGAQNGDVNATLGGSTVSGQDSGGLDFAGQRH
jgi:hypothetical protein